MKRSAVYVVYLIAIGLGICVAPTSKNSAQAKVEWVNGIPEFRRHYHRNEWRRRHYHRREHWRRYHRRRRRVIIIRRPHHPRSCRSAIMVVGDQAQSTNGAKAQAWKAFQQQARALYGEIYSDPRFSRHAKFRCWHSSIENFANRATKAVGVDTQFERCSVRAYPCRAPEIEDERR